MSQYTLTIKQLVENNINIFDFNYDLFDENYRVHFEKMIIEHFYFREIGHETVFKFKHFLKLKLKLIMPYYNKLYLTENMEQRILDNYDVVETYKRDISGSASENNTSSFLNLKSDTPNSRVDITTNDYVDQINKNTNNDNTSLINSNTENWTRTMKGNIGVQTDADAIIKYRTSLIKIDEMILKELNELFMGVY